MGWKRMLPTFSTFVRRVFDGCQKLFWLFSKALVTVVKNYQTITSLCMNLFCYACGILLNVWNLVRAKCMCGSDDVVSKNGCHFSDRG